MSLKEESELIKKDLSAMIEELKQQKESIMKEIESEKEKYDIAAAQGDHSENAELQDARSALMKAFGKLAKVEDKLQKSIKLTSDEYTPIGMVVLYSTVLLECQDGTSYIIQIYPEGVSDLNRRIVSKDSTVGRSLWLKQVGDQIVMEHRVTGEVLRYTVKDIY